MGLQGISERLKRDSSMLGMLESNARKHCEELQPTALPCSLLTIKVNSTLSAAPPECGEE